MMATTEGSPLTATPAKPTLTDDLAAIAEVAASVSTHTAISYIDAMTSAMAAWERLTALLAAIDRMAAQAPDLSQADYEAWEDVWEARQAWQLPH